MTRLKTEDIYNISTTLQAYNQELIIKTGRSLKEIAYQAVIDQKHQQSELFSFDQDIKVGIIPITSGLGVINGFSQSVDSIVKFLGFKSFVTNNTDVAGISEAIQQGAEVLMMADDHNFVAINVLTKKVVDNGDATARGFVSAFESMLGGLNNKKVLIVGAGIVGTSAAETMAKKGSLVSVFDINLQKAYKLAENIQHEYQQKINVETNLEKALLEHENIFDACPLEGFIRTEHIKESSVIAAPGVPFCVAEDVPADSIEKIIHDPLQLGVATMIMEAATIDRE